MPDDVTLNSMSGGPVVATDEVPGTGEHVQVVKLAQSADGDRTPIDADANGLRVQGATEAKKGSSLTSFEVSAGAMTRLLVCAADPDRRAVSIYVTPSSGQVFIGDSASTVMNGFPVPAGGYFFITEAAAAAVYATGTNTIYLRVLTEGA